VDEHPACAQSTATTPTRTRRSHELSIFASCLIILETPRLWDIRCSPPPRNVAADSILLSRRLCSPTLRLARWLFHQKQDQDKAYGGQY